MRFGPPTRPFGAPGRGPWTLVVVVAGVLALCCCAGLLVAIAQGGGAPSPAGSTSAQTSASGSAAAAPASAAPGRVTVPGLVGVRLPDAEERLEALGLGDPHIVDATGRGRSVLSRQNWVVRAQEPPAGSRVAASTTITLRVGKPTDAAPTEAPQDGVIPDVVCRDLQAAQDALQTAGFYVLDSVDGSGEGRRQLIDRNWVVVRQSVPAGSRPVRSTRVLLTVVKLGEPTDACPS